MAQRLILFRDMFHPMKVVFLLLITFFLLNQPAFAYTQESATAPSRTPEQEAALQTDKMKQELNLDAEQAAAIYQINLRHARERQVSNSRAQALERVKNKDNEVRKVLTDEQYLHLQEKRYDRSPNDSRFIPQRTRSVSPANNESTPSLRGAPATVTRPTERNNTERNVRPAAESSPAVRNPSVRIPAEGSRPATSAPTSPPASTRPDTRSNQSTPPSNSGQRR